MDRNLALLMVAFWVGISLAFFAVTYLRHIHRVQLQRGEQGFSKAVPLYVRILFLGFAITGAFGFAGLVSNFVEQQQREQTAFLFLFGVAAGGWAAYRLR